MFDKITLTPDGYVFIRWFTKFGNVWESFIDPTDVPAFIRELMRID